MPVTSRTPTPDPICVLLADDHTLVREALLALLTLESDIRVVGQAENGFQAVALAGQLCPDVIVMDISMPVMNGLEAGRQILLTSSSAKVLMISSLCDGVYIEAARALGAAGYLIKQNAPLALPSAIRQAHQGAPFLDPRGR